MSLHEIVRLPFLKHKDAPEEFEFLVSSIGSGKYGYFLKGTMVKNEYLEGVIPKKEHDQAFSKGYSIGLYDESIKYLMYEAKLTHLDELKDGPMIVSFKKNEKDYLVVNGVRPWAE